MAGTWLTVTAKVAEYNLQAAEIALVQSNDDVVEEKKSTTNINEVEAIASRTRTVENFTDLEQEEDDKRNTLLAMRARNGDYDEGNTTSQPFIYKGRADSAKTLYLSN